MQRLRTSLLILAAIVATWGLASASAQSSIPNGVFVNDVDGTTWLVLDGQRVALPIWQASEADIAAIPQSDRYAVMNDAGGLVAGDRPSWLADAPATVPSASQTAVASTSMKDFAGNWWRHGLSLNIAPDGSAQAVWRVYRWCSDSPPPCDDTRGNEIVSGGRATISFTMTELPSVARDWQPDALRGSPLVFQGVQLPIARGQVVSTTDPSLLRMGEVAFALLPYETASLQQQGDGILMCRPADSSAFSEAQRKYRACGA